MVPNWQLPNLCEGNRKYETSNHKFKYAYAKQNSKVETKYLQEFLNSKNETHYKKQQQKNIQIQK